MNSELPENLKNEKIQLTIRKERGKLSRLKLEKKQEIFSQNPSSINKPQQTIFGTIKYTQNDIQQVGSKKKPQPKRPKKGKLSRNELKSLNKIPKHMNYEALEILNQLWLKYFEVIMNEYKKGNIEILLRSDYHGALMSVTQARNPTYVGLEGMMIQETENTFKLLTKTGVVKGIFFSFLFFFFSYFN